MESYIACKLVKACVRVYDGRVCCGYGGLCTTGKNTTRQFQNNNYYQLVIFKMIVQTVHDQGSSDRFKCPQCHCTKSSIDTGKGFMGFS